MAQDARPLIVLAGRPHPACQTLLETEAHVVVCEALTEEGVIRAAAEAEGILFRARPACTEALMTACKRLKVIGRYGAGLDIVDLAAATRLGIAVVHAPGANATAVAEHALMLMLACVKRTLAIDRLTRAGVWRGEPTTGVTELAGKTLGIVGVGNIGRITARLAGAFGMQVLGYDPYVAEDELRRRSVEPQETLEAMLPRCDVVSFHVPLTPETQGLIGDRTIGLMKDRAVLINTCRGPVQDEAALLRALTGGKLRAAGLDVWETEPVPAGNPLLALDNVVCTPHMAGVSEEADRAIGLQVASEMLRVVRGEKPQVLGNPDLWLRLGHLR